MAEYMDAILIARLAGEIPGKRVVEIVDQTISDTRKIFKEECGDGESDTQAAYAE